MGIRCSANLNYMEDERVASLGEHVVNTAVTA